MISKKKNTDQWKSLMLLYRLLLNPNYCPKPISSFSTKEFNDLIYYATQNKTTAFLEHLIKCSKCSKFFPNRQQQKIKALITQRYVLLMDYNREIKKIDKLFKKHKLKALLFKDTSWLPIYKQTNLFYTPSDIDILVSKKDFQKDQQILLLSGWKKIATHSEFFRFRKYHWQEVAFQKPGLKSKIEIDLQWGAGKTSNNYFSKFSTKDMIKFIKTIICKNDYGLTIPPKHIQLLLLVIMIYYHDNMLGLRQLFEIKHIALSLTNQQWKDIIKLTNVFGLTHSLMFTLLYLEKLFSFKMIPNHTIKYASFIIKVCALCYPRLTQYLRRSDNIKKNLFINIINPSLRFLIRIH